MNKKEIDAIPHFRLIEETLTDGSKAYNIEVLDDMGRCVVQSCDNEKKTMFIWECIKKFQWDY